MSFTEVLNNNGVLEIDFVEAIQNYNANNTKLMQLSCDVDRTTVDICKSETDISVLTSRVMTLENENLGLRSQVQELQRKIFPDRFV